MDGHDLTKQILVDSVTSLTEATSAPSSSKSLPLLVLMSFLDGFVVDSLTRGQAGMLCVVGAFAVVALRAWYACCVLVCRGVGFSVGGKMFSVIA